MNRRCTARQGCVYVGTGSGNLTIIDAAAPSRLAGLTGIVMRAKRTGRIRQWTTRNVGGQGMAAPLTASIVVNDPAAMRKAAELGLGVAMLAISDALPQLKSRARVRLAPKWYADTRTISLYYASRLHFAGQDATHAGAKTIGSRTMSLRAGRRGSGSSPWSSATSGRAADAYSV